MWRKVYSDMLDILYKKEEGKKLRKQVCHRELLLGSRSPDDWIAPLCFSLVLTNLFLWLLSHVRLFATWWAVVRQAPLSMGFPRQEYWSGLLFPCPDLPDPGIEPASSALAGRSVTTERPHPSLALHEETNKQGLLLCGLTDTRHLGEWSLQCREEEPKQEAGTSLLDFLVCARKTVLLSKAPQSSPGHPGSPFRSQRPPELALSWVNLVGGHARSCLCLWTASVERVFHSPVPSAPRGTGFAEHLILKSRASGRSGMEGENGSVSHCPQVPSSALVHKAGDVVFFFLKKAILLAHGKQIRVVFGPRLGSRI